MQQGPCTERARRLFSADRSVDLAARKLAQYDGGKRVPATVAAISDSSGYGFLLRPSLMSCSDAIFRALRTRNSSKVVWLCTSDAMLNLDKHSNAFWFSGQNPAAPRQHHHISEPYFFMSLRVVFAVVASPNGSASPKCSPNGSYCCPRRLSVASCVSRTNSSSELTSRTQSQKFGFRWKLLHHSRAANMSDIAQPFPCG